MAKHRFLLRAASFMLFGSERRSLRQRLFEPLTKSDWIILAVHVGFVAIMISSILLFALWATRATP